MRNDEGYAVYQNMDTETRLQFVEDEQEAIAVIDTTLERLYAERSDLSNDASRDGIFGEGLSRVTTCDEFSRPFEFNGLVERHILPDQNGCSLAKASYTEVLERNAEAISFWEGAKEALSNNTAAYTIDRDNFTEPVPQSKALLIAEDTAKCTGSAALLLLLGAGGMTSLRRRQSRKKDAATPKP
jgi:hypothetical protein